MKWLVLSSLISILWLPMEQTVGGADEGFFNRKPEFFYTGLPTADRPTLDDEGHVVSDAPAGGKVDRAWAYYDRSGAHIVYAHRTYDDGDLYTLENTEMRGEAQGQGHVIWHRHHDSAIYTSASISLADMSLCAGTWLNPPQQVELVPLMSTGVPDWTYPGIEFYVAASRAEEIIVGVDYDFSDSTAVIYKWNADSETPQWSYTVHPCVYGSMERQVVVSPDGSTIAILVTMLNPDFTRLYYFDSNSPVPRGIYDVVDESGSRCIVISTHGEYIAFITGYYLYVIDRDAGAVRWSEDMGFSNVALAISGDGKYIAYGFDKLIVREWNGVSYNRLWTLDGGDYYYLCGCDISSSSNILASGWTAHDFSHNVVMPFEITSSTPLWIYYYQQNFGGYQELLSDIAVTATGEYIAASSWGDDTNTNPEIHVFKRTDSNPHQTVDTPGSMFDIDIVSTSDGGAFLCACGKNVHANQTGWGGDLYSIRVGSPTPVSLTSFHAASNPNYIDITWTTASELGCQCWEIHRSEREEGRYVKIGELSGHGQTETAHTYQWVDRQVSPGLTYFYKLKQVDFYGSSWWSSVVSATASPMVPENYALSQNYPNPFNPTTEITYTIPEDEHVSLKVYNVLGAEVATLVDADQEAHCYTVYWNAEGVASGVYFCWLRAGEFEKSIKMVLLK